MQGDMRRDFASRDDLIAYLRAEFPEAALRDPHVAEVRGGRAAAEARLHAVDVVRYKASRNWLNGAVSRLSPYLRHGVVTLAEVRHYAVRRWRRDQADKFVNELAWRDYWQRLYSSLGDAIWQSREGCKTGWKPGDYQTSLPDDVQTAQTGLDCMDSFIRELYETGYLHNHARMWVAAYLVHWRRIAWDAGARWFLEHLLDGDPASNNLSWQWVASTFSHKPYIFNRETLERFTNGVYCRRCPLRGRCVFEGTYEDHEARLFPNRPSLSADNNPPPRRRNDRR